MTGALELVAVVLFGAAAFAVVFMACVALTAAAKWWVHRGIKWDNDEGGR